MRGAAYTLARLRCPRGVTVPGVKREAGAHAIRVQGRRCPRNGKRERDRDKPLCRRHGKERSAGSNPLASPETGRDTFGRLALGEARSIAMPPGNRDAAPSPLPERLHSNGYARGARAGVD